MERKIRKKNMVYPVFASIVCVIGFFYLHCKGWGKQSILLVPVFAFNIYRVYKNIFDA